MLPLVKRAPEAEGAKRLVVRHLPGGNAVMIVFQEREFRLDQAPSQAYSVASAGVVLARSTGPRQGFRLSKLKLKPPQPASDAASTIPNPVFAKWMNFMRRIIRPPGRPGCLE